LNIYNSVISSLYSPLNPTNLTKHPNLQLSKHFQFIASPYATKCKHRRNLKNSHENDNENDLKEKPKSKGDV